MYIYIICLYIYTVYQCKNHVISDVVKILVLSTGFIICIYVYTSVKKHVYIYIYVVFVIKLTVSLSIWLCAMIWWSFLTKIISVICFFSQTFCISVVTFLYQSNMIFMKLIKMGPPKDDSGGGGPNFGSQFWDTLYGCVWKRLLITPKIDGWKNTPFFSLKIKCNGLDVNVPLFGQTMTNPYYHTVHYLSLFHIE